MRVETPPNSPNPSLLKLVVPCLYCHRNDFARRNQPSKRWAGASDESEEESIVGVPVLALFVSSIADLQRERPSLTENVKLAGRGIRRLVTLFTPVARLVAEYDRRHHQMMEHGLFEEDIDLTDPRAVAVKAE